MRPNGGCRSRTVSAAFLGVACAVVVCKRVDVRVATPQPESGDAGRADAQRANNEPSPSSALNILIDPHFEETGRQIVLAFCFEDDPSHDPLIHRIRMARIDGKPGTVEIAAKGESWLWKEWIVGTVPAGFRSVERTPTPPGVYEVTLMHSSGTACAGCRSPTTGCASCRGMNSIPGRRNIVRVSTDRHGT